jgi:hypothetical protein
MTDTFQVIMQFSEDTGDENFKQRIDILLTDGMQRKGTLQNLIDFLKDYQDATLSGTHTSNN